MVDVIPFNDSSHFKNRLVRRWERGVGKRVVKKARGVVVVEGGGGVRVVVVGGGPPPP